MSTTGAVDFATRNAMPSTWRVRQLIARGMMLSDIAERVGVGHNVISNIRDGVTMFVSHDIGNAIAAIALPPVDHTDHDWTARAACIGLTDIFYSHNVEDVEAACRTCSTCPVLAQCKAASVGEVDGVWAGVWKGGRHDRRHGVKRADILDLLQRNPDQEWTATDIGVALSAKPNTTYAALRYLIKQGQVIRTINPYPTVDTYRIADDH